MAAEETQEQKPKAAAKPQKQFTDLASWMSEKFPYHGTTQRNAFKMFYAQARDAYKNDYDAIFEAWVTTGALTPPAKVEGK